MGSLQNLCKKTAQALDAYKLLSFLTQENACLDMESLHLQIKKACTALKARGSKYKFRAKMTFCWLDQLKVLDRSSKCQSDKLE